MTFDYWFGAVARIAANLAADGRRKRSNRFAFTQELLRTGYTYDQRPRLPELHFLDLYPQAEQLIVPIGELTYRRSNANPLELFCLRCIASIRKPKRIFEFGTFDGATTLQLARTCLAAEILTLDLDPASVNDAQPATIHGEVENVRAGGVGCRFASLPESQRIKQLLGNSSTFDFTAYYGSVDFAFVDACHDYAFVKTDTGNALRMAPCGVVIWHDYCPGWPGVIRAIDELLPNYPVKHIAWTTLAVLDLSPV